MIAGEAAALIMTVALLHLAAPHGGLGFGERAGSAAAAAARGFGSAGAREASIGSVGGLGTRRGGGGGSERRADLLLEEQSPATTLGRDDEGRARSGSSRRLLEELEGRLLEVFGLQRRPRPGTGIAVPAYLVQLYRAQQHTGRGGGPRRRWVRADKERVGKDDVDVEEEKEEEVAFPREAQGRANTVRGFHHDESTEKLSLGQSTEDGTTWHFLFNLSSIPDSEEVTAAELRVHHTRVHSPCPSSSPACELAPRLERINVYEVVAPPSSPSGAASRLLDTRVVRTNESRWETFDVSPAVSRWTRGSAPNWGFAVEVLPVRRPSGGVAANGVPSEAVLVQPRSGVASLFPGDGSHQTEPRPLLVTFGSDGRAPFTPRSRARRSVGGAPRQAAHKARRKPRYSCRRHALYVDFREVGWNDWIVAPPGYHAYFCHGECPFPLADHLNSTNHAIVQTLVNSVNASIPRACCVPTELSPISMLYLDEYGKVVLKNYQDMVVEGCGCR